MTAPSSNATLNPQSSVGLLPSMVVISDVEIATASARPRTRAALSAAEASAASSVAMSMSAYDVAAL
jgi:hypothetical protein